MPLTDDQKIDDAGKPINNNLSEHIQQYTLINIADVRNYFLKLLEQDRDLSSGIAAIKTLLMILEKKQCKYLVHILQIIEI